jgi:hypothetical protein
LLVVGGLVWDLRTTPTTTHPFLAAAVDAGEPIPAESVEWREIPTGLLAPVETGDGVAAFDLAAGDPITSSSITTAPTVPDDWWLVPVGVGDHARPGDSVMLIVVDPPTSIPGKVVVAQSGDPYSSDFRPAAVAVPAEAAPMVAAAAQQGMLVTAVRP